MKFLELMTTLRTRVVSNKRVLSGILATFVVILSIGGYLGYQELAKRWAVPIVSGANFSLEYRKIPFDAKSIDITFSSNLDPASLTNKNVTINPFVEGKASLKEGNTLSYALDKKLVIGETYTLTIGVVREMNIPNVSNRYFSGRNSKTDIERKSHILFKNF